MEVLLRAVKTRARAVSIFDTQRSCAAQWLRPKKSTAAVDKTSAAQNDRKEKIKNYDVLKNVYDHSSIPELFNVSK